MKKEKSRRAEKEENVRRKGGDLFFQFVVCAVLTLSLVVTLYPMIFVLSASFSDPQAVMTGKVHLFPVDITLDGYKYILQYREIWSGYANTIFYTVVGTILNLIVTLPCAYALSHRKLKGRGLLMTLFIITMYFNGGMIPNYLNVMDLGLLNTRTIVLVMGLVSTYNLIVARTFFSSSIPWELHEAAILDGASHFQIFGQVVLPLSKAIIAVQALYYAVAHWNSYFNEMLYLSDRSKFPLQVILREILTLSQYQAQAMEEGGYSVEQMMEMVKAMDTANLIKYCVIVVSVVPMMIFYPFLQKFFAKGVMIGAVKG
ncbi:MAG: carbohydrate ABC transporter permease [Lachnospiraceae bacterium]|nr:carbohydrate ABC transporter permease [Lachnospiraceae bacterium]